MKKIYLTILLALAASVGMMNAKVTWNSSNISNLQVSGTYQSYSKEGVTLGANADMIDAFWLGYGDESMDGISFNVHATGGFTFSNTLGKNFTKIEMFPNGSAGWDYANLGSGWSFSGGYGNPVTVTWTGNASTVDLLNGESDFNAETVKSIVFYFVGDSQEPDPTYTVALQAGTVNADKVTLSATSAVEGATVTVTPNEEYEITAFSAKYNTTEEAPSTLDPGTGAYSFTMPAYAVTIEATIALKPVPEGDIFAGFTATAGSGGFDNEGSAKLVDNKFTPGDVQTNWTKWCANDGHKSVPTGESDACWWIDFEASAALNLTGYILTTGNDTGSEHGRNPKNWLLKAKLNAGDAWTTIATVTNDVTMKNQSFKDYKFFVDQSGPYKYFRFEVFANQGASVMQLCELRLIGTEADVYSVAGTMNEWSTIANQMTLVGEDLYMAEMTLSGYKEFKIVKNHAVWYGSSTIYRRLSDVNLWDAEDVNDQPNDNIAFELASTSVVKFYWDAANDKVYLTLNPATITCTVAGAADLVGVDWKPSAVANDMTNNGDSTFTLLKEDVTLGVGNHAYKVAYNHDWAVNFGDAEGNNAIVNITEAGIYDVTFSFNWKTKEVSAVAVLQEPVVVIPVVKLTGNFTNPEWNAESAITLVDNGDGTCSVTQHFAVDVISFKLIVDGNWYADENHSMMTRGNQGEGWEIAYDTGMDNTQLDVDMEGDYVFTYTYATRKLLVTYPLIVREAANTNYQSLCTPYDATLDGATAYTVGAASESGVTLNPVVGNLEAGHSYIIKPTEIGTVTVNFVAEGTSTTTPVYPNGTGLYGVLVNNYVYNYATEKGKAWVNVFVLLNDNMFHQVVSGGEVTITPTHAYLHIEGPEIVPNPGAPGIRIIETATNIENIEGKETAVKFIENGKLFIRKNGVVYDVTGAVVK